MNTRSKTDKTASASQKLRLEEIRKELRAERISYDELHELQSLAQYIDKGDVELLEAAGVDEYQAQHEESGCTDYLQHTWDSCPENKAQDMTTQAQIRESFWEHCFPEVKKSYTRKRQNEYPADVRCAFVDYVESLARNGEISEKLASEVTL